MADLDIRVFTFTEDDAEAFQCLRLRALKEHPGAFGSSYEAESGLSLETVAARMRRTAESPNAFTLGAYRDGELIGMVGFYRDTLSAKVRHKGHVWGTYVASERQGEGVGRRLMQELLARAARIDGLEQVHLDVVTGNEAARGLYASLGFETYGVEPNALIVDGERLDEAHMVFFIADR